MKKSLIFILIILLLIPCSCGKTEDKTQNTAPEVVINLPTDNTVNGYRVESSSSSNSMPDSIKAEDVGVKDNTKEVETTSKDYCGNKNSKVFHKLDCGSVTSMKENNRYYGTRESLIKEGYKPCGKCNP